METGRYRGLLGGSVSALKERGRKGKVGMNSTRNMISLAGTGGVCMKSNK